MGFPTLPPVPTLIPPPPPPPTLADKSVADAGARQRQIAMSSQGIGSTIKTGAQGLTNTANTAQKTLLGG